MKSLIIILALLLLGFTYWGVRTFFLLQKSKSLVQSAKPFNKVGDPRSQKFLFVGDSTGVGVGSMDSDQTLAGYFSADFPDRTIVNLSVSGRKTEEIVPVLQAQPSESFDWVFIQIGGNDILYFTSNGKLEIQIKQALREANRVGKHVLLITSGNVGIAPFFPHFLGTLWTTKTLEVRGLFMRVAQSEDVVYVDLFQSRENDLFLTDTAKFYSKDLLHPAGPGYRHWYEQAREAIRQRGLEDIL